jgi:hypothetical protein
MKTEQEGRTNVLDNSDLEEVPVQDKSFESLTSFSDNVSEKVGSVGNSLSSGATVSLCNCRNMIIMLHVYRGYLMAFLTWLVHQPPLGSFNLILVYHLVFPSPTQAMLDILKTVQDQATHTTQLSKAWKLVRSISILCSPSKPVQRTQEIWQ